MVDTVKFIREFGESFYNFEEDSKYSFAYQDKIQGWCPTPLMWLLNTALKCLRDGEEYLEIGSFCGRSLAAALKNNSATAHVIDPLNLWTQNGTTEDLWFQTVSQFHLADRITLHRDFAENFCGELPPIGVFFYDGNHDTGHTYEALRKYQPFLAESAIIIVDDYEIYGGDQQNVFSGHTLDIQRPVKTDTDRWIRENRSYVKFHLTTPWLNGQAILFYEA